MSELFLSILNMSISASWIVLVVLLLRLLLKKAPKWVSVVLWGIVAVRLVCPFSIESVWSLIPSTQTVSPDIMMDRTPHIESGISIVDQVVNPVIEQSFSPAPMTSINPLQVWIPILAVCWLLGVAGLLIYTAMSYFRLVGKVKTAVLLTDHIYQSECVASPFVLGIFCPKIYLPFSMNEQDREHVIAHEQAHIRRKDYLWKPIGFLLLAIHWFNPLMWLGYVLLCRDIELACDEKVIKELSTDQKADYSQALLTCSISRRSIAACPLAFGEVDVKNRVKSVLSYKKPAFWIIVVAIVTSIVLSVCFLTNPRTSLNDELAVFLDGQIAEHHYSEGDTDGHFIAISSKVLDVKKKGDTTIIYTWVLYNEYSFENGQIKNESGAHTPTVITVKQTGEHRHYELVEYWTPRDGAYYPEDIKQKFPWYLHGKALDSQRYIDEQEAFCVAAARDYYAEQGIIINADVSFANYAQSDQIKAEALNKEQLSIEGHLPIYQFDTLAQLQEFKQKFGAIYTMDQGLDEVPSFNSVTEVYGEAFFKDNSLLLVYVSAGNMTHRFALNRIDYTEDTCTLHIKETTGEKYTDTAMSGWFIILPISDARLKNYTNLDAVLIGVDQPIQEDELTLSQPPVLQVKTTEQTIEAMKGTLTWTHQLADGTSQSIAGDSSHPTAMKDRLPVLVRLGSKAVLSFGDGGDGTLPDSISIAYYSSQTDGAEEITGTYDGNQIVIPLKDEFGICVVTAKWSRNTYQGTVTYGFLVEELKTEDDSTQIHFPNQKIE